METVILKLTAKRLAHRQFEIAIDDGTIKEVRVFDDASAVYASHVMLREYLIDHPDADIELYTNANNLILDIQDIKADKVNKRLTQILHETQVRFNVNFTKVAHLSAL